MSPTIRIARYCLRDVARGRWLLGYGALLFGLAQALVLLEADVQRAAAGLINVTLLVVPLVGLLFGTLYLYGARDAVRLLLAQPVGRPQLFAGLYAGIALPLLGVELLGLGIPLAAGAIGEGASPGGLGSLLATVAGLTLVSVSLAFLIGVSVRDRAAGMGLAIVLWLALTLLYDGLLMALAVTLPHAALERPALVATLLNPVDTARILLLIQFDAAVLLGYTGAVFRGFFGGTAGVAIATSALLAWITGPLALAARRFRSADL